MFTCADLWENVSIDLHKLSLAVRTPTSWKCRAQGFFLTRPN